MPDLTVDAPRRLVVSRVGYKPEPWAWVGWEWATDGRFHGRWDDFDGNFRTIYAGSTLLACLLELLADFRPDPRLTQVLDDIDVDDDDEAIYPTSPSGVLDPSWLEPRSAASAKLSGRFCSVATRDSLATLHPQFVGLALQLGLEDFDASALKDSGARRLTQSVASHVYAMTNLDGVQFASRHGDDLVLWAIFERPEDGTLSACLSDLEHHDLTRENPALRRAIELLGLRWSDEPNPTPATTEGRTEAAAPLPLVHAAADDALAATYPDGEALPETPVGAATLWWLALRDPDHYRTALAQLSADASVWGDFLKARETLRGLSIMQHPIYSDERPGELAHVKFIDTGDTTAQAFDDAPLDDVWILTLIKVGDWWRVWGLSHNHLPLAGDVGLL